MAGRNYHAREFDFVIVPSNTLLVTMRFLEYTPVEGWLFDYIDENDVTTRYRVQDVVMTVKHVVAVPPSPPSDPGTPVTYVPSWRAEITVV